MQPNQPLPAPPPMPLPPNGQSQYEFILNNSPPKKGLGALFGNGNSQKQRIIIIAAGACMLFIVVLLFVAILGGGSKGNAQALIELTEQQQELIRVATIGVTDSTSAATKDLAITAELSLQSSQNDTLAVLQKSGHQVSSGELALKKNPSTDQQLSTAESNSNFDTTFNQLFDQQLAAYRTALQNAYKSSTQSSEKQVIQASFNSVTLLLGKQSSS